MTPEPVFFRLEHDPNGVLVDVVQARLIHGPDWILDAATFTVGDPLHGWSFAADPADVPTIPNPQNGPPT